MNPIFYYNEVLTRKMAVYEEINRFITIYIIYKIKNIQIIQHN